MKRNNGYKQTCKKDGKGKYSNLYQDFGDIHSTDFKSWWKTHGVALFSEPQRDKLFHVVKSQIDEMDLANPSLLYLQIPLNLPIRIIKQKFDQTMKQFHHGKKGIRHARDSHARYPVIGQPNINALKLTLMVYDYRIEHPELKLWEVALVLDQFKTAQFDKNSSLKLNGYDQKNLMTATVSRYLRKADVMIENVGLGRFPDPNTPQVTTT